MTNKICREDDENSKCFVGPLTKEEVQEAIHSRVSKVDRELRGIFQFLKGYPRSVSIYGSARFGEDHEHYKQAREIAFKISKELGYTIVTGGGGGIMEAANRGAFEAGGQSIGLNIKLPEEQQVNKYVTASFEAYYFFVRKVGLSFAAEAYLFFPGGFGTMDEFYEILTLVQTGKIRKIPIILVGRDFWEPLDKFMKEAILADHKAISPTDINLYTILDNSDEIVELIRNTPILNAIPFVK